jgi:CRP-like cAMP-binding protein
MISPELLRRYPFFGHLDDSQLKSIAMISELESFDQGQIIIHEGKPAGALYLLVDGSIDIFYAIDKQYQPDLNKPDLHREFPVGEVNPGEPFGISALSEPPVYTATSRAVTSCRVIKIEAGPLQSLFEADCHLAYVLMRQMFKAAIERLHATRIQLAAALV